MYIFQLNNKYEDKISHHYITVMRLMNHNYYSDIITYFSICFVCFAEGNDTKQFLSPKREGRDGKLLTRRVTHSKVDSNTVPCEKMIELHPAPHDSLR